MATKLRKNSRITLAAVSMFLSIFMLTTLLFAGMYTALDAFNGDRQIISSLSNEVYHSKIFKERIAYFLNGMADMVIDIDQTDSAYIYQKIITEEVENNNLLVYAANTMTGYEYMPNATDFGIKLNQKPSLSQEFDNYFFFDGRTLILCYEGTEIVLTENEGREYFRNQEIDVLLRPRNYRFCYLYLAVNNEITPGADGSYLYRSIETMDNIRILIAILFAGGIAGILLGIFAARRKKLARRGNKAVAQWCSKFFLEVKLLLVGIVIYLAYIVYRTYFEYEVHFYEILPVLGVALLLLCIFTAFYALFVDLFFNREDFFTNNFFWDLRERYRAYEKKNSIENLLMVRFRWYSVFLSIFLCAFVVFLIAYIFTYGEVINLFLMLISGSAALFCYHRYKDFYRRFLNDVTTLSRQVERLKEGEYGGDIELSRGSLLQPVADSLASVRSGIRDTVDEYVKNERIKVELITNVSHDLKTPLTSIVSYVDLLSKEQDLPLRAREYVEVLEDKSLRLKYLIDDLFELSKASSRNLDIQRELLDFGKLVQQVCADMEDVIEASGLKFVYKLSSEPVLIRSDGNRLHRVLDNLIVNASKYSMPGTRVHVSLTVHLNTAVFEISNISATEIDYTEDEIISRFVRGDKNRSTEGSGLGLAIAKSYTELCGGTMRIHLDGDLFKAALYFTVEEPEGFEDTKKDKPAVK